MENILRILFFLLLIISFSCEDQPFIIQCADCTEDEPVDTELTAKLDSKYYYQSVVEIWEGNIEDSILVGSAVAYSDTFILRVTLNKKYTLTATYYVSDDKYIAVDSATPRVKYDKAQCDNPCYYVYDRKCDLRLKYTR
jgi:hypothetical protein